MSQLPNISHIGWAVHSIDAAMPPMEALGFKLCGERVLDSSRNVSISFVRNPDGLTIELIEPANESSPITSLLKKNALRLIIFVFAAPFHHGLNARHS